MSDHLSATRPRNGFDRGVPGKWFSRWRKFSSLRPTADARLRHSSHDTRFHDFRTAARSAIRLQITLCAARRRNFRRMRRSPFSVAVTVRVRPVHVLRPGRAFPGSRARVRCATARFPLMARRSSDLAPGRRRRPVGMTVAGLLTQQRYPVTVIDKRLILSLCRGGIAVNQAAWPYSISCRSARARPPESLRIPQINLYARRPRSGRSTSAGRLKFKRPFFSVCDNANIWSATAVWRNSPRLACDRIRRHVASFRIAKRDPRTIA